jgi:DNA helicase II / ATP-dependent DNA helicase PcrA
VTLSTVHAAKGLEFPVVIVAGMEEGIFPHSRAAYDQTELEEERRLCYVAMTRAKERLYMTHATSRIFFGKLEYNLPSRFLGDFHATYQRSEAAPSAYSMFSDTQKIATPSHSEPRYVPELEPGDAIKHGLFGIGTVIEISGSFALVYFQNKGNKKINLDFAPVEKITS